MTIPPSREIYRRLLDLLSDEKAHSLQDSVERLANTFRLTDEERNLRTLTGRGTFYTRVSWAVGKCRRSGLLENTRLGEFKITNEGLQLLKNDQDINGFLNRRLRRPAKKPNGRTSAKLDEGNPLEVLEYCVDDLNRALKEDLRGYLARCTYDAFERLVVQLLVKMGYGGSAQDAGMAVGKSRDGGIDGVIKEDELGLGNIYIQAKRRDGDVGDPEIREFVSTLDSKRASKGVLITTSNFTAQAKKTEEMTTKSLVLINGEDLADYMIRYNLGVSITDTYEIKRVDARFFDTV